ncbi:MAG: hypothetical protein K2X04_02705 [Burkholderiales bacterium]|nr:hypothetical protein [Burkholderiales bacterium]
MQFKSLGEQIEFFLNPNNLDLWELQKSFKTMIDRYYRAKLTSRTLFSLQKPIDEIEELCEIIRLISNKKATKQCEEAAKNLQELLDRCPAASYFREILNKNIKEISELTDATIKKQELSELASHLQKILRAYFKKCQRNYEFQEIIKTSKSGWPETWEFLSRSVILTSLSGLITYVISLIPNPIISNLSFEYLKNILNNMSAIIMALIICVILPAIYIALAIFDDSRLILDKIKAKVVRNQSDAKKFFLKEIIKLIFITAVLGLVVSTIHAHTFKFSNSSLAFLIIAVILTGLCVTAKHIFSGIKDFLFNLRAVVLILLPMLFPLLWAAVATIDKNHQVVDYILVMELIVIVIILITLVEMKFYNAISKAGLFVLIYFVASWIIISPQINILELLGLRNNPNIISLLKLNENSPFLIEELLGMGFQQLQYNGNESQASDLQLERYVFESSIESTVYLTEKDIPLADLKNYVARNKISFCNSKLNRAVLSEFENGDESKHYFGYEGCNANVNAFEADEKIKLVNKLFLVRQYESNYTYWIFGAHINWKKPDELIISAAKNDNFNTIVLNKDRGMLYYDETPFSTFTKPENLHNFSLTKYGNESSQSY